MNPQSLLTLVLVVFVARVLTPVVCLLMACLTLAAKAALWVYQTASNW